MYKLSRDQLKEISSEILYLTEIYNGLLNPMEIEEIRLSLRYMKLSLQILDGVIKNITQESLKHCEEKKSDELLNE